MNLSRFQILQQADGGTGDQSEVFIWPPFRKPANLWFVFVLIFSTSAFLVFLNGPVEASPPQAGKPLAHQGDSHFPVIGQANQGTILYPQKRYMDGGNQSIPLIAFVSADGKAVAEKKADQSEDDVEFNDFCRRHSKLLFILTNVFGSFTLCVLLAWFRNAFFP